MTKKTDDEKNASAQTARGKNVKVEGLFTGLKNGGPFTADSVELGWSAGAWTLFASSGAYATTAFFAFSIRIPSSAKDLPVKAEFNSGDSGFDYTYHAIEQDLQDWWLTTLSLSGQVSVEIDYKTSKFEGKYSYQSNEPVEPSIWGSGSFNLKPV